MKNMQKNRIAGALFGVAVGDALGGPVEFMGPQEIAARYGRLDTMVGGGWLSLKPGEITDDTQMTLCVAEGIVENPGNPYQAIGRRFIEWYRSGPKDIGNACASSIFRASKIGARNGREDAPQASEWYQAAEEAQQASGHATEGNGALMRTIYPGVFYADSGRGSAVAGGISRLTHAGFRSTEGCILYTRMVNYLTESESPRGDIRAFLAEFCAAIPEYKKAVTEPVTEYNGGGYVVDAMRIAVSCLAFTNSFKDAVVMAVNMGGDADTNAAITGGLAGAWYGFDAIPEEWVESLAPEVRRKLEYLTAAAVKSREG